MQNSTEDINYSKKRNGVSCILGNRADFSCIFQTFISNCISMYNREILMLAELGVLNIMKSVTTRIKKLKNVSFS